MDLAKNLRLSLLAKDNNDRGDLLTRLSRDLFHSLGYGDFLLNVSKTGREIDISGKHLFEQSSMRAECKATKSPTGGNQVNKFVGVLEAERRQASDRINGYFVSLGGFTDSAKFQEESISPRRIILLEPTQIVNQLIRARIVASPTDVVSEAARLYEQADIPPPTKFELELLGYEGGWVWCIYATKQGARVNNCLIHADGAALLEEVVLDIRELAKLNKHDLARYPSVFDGKSPDLSVDHQVMNAYFEFVKSECGAITLEGLPADQEVGSKRFSLEDLYVDLFLAPVEDDEADREKPIDPIEDWKTISEDESVGLWDALNGNRRIAILGLPGCGKTTSLKHFAIECIKRIIDNQGRDSLGGEERLPILIRCRQLGDNARRPITEIIGDLPDRAEVPELRPDFMTLVRRTIQQGNLLLLIDGLDEIRDPSNRRSFVTQLRTFIARYPTVSVVVTSRETGFREVAGAVREICTTFRVRSLSPKAITRLTVAWHKHVIGDKSAVETDAHALASAILANDRVHRLANNPLLLTTLLLVRRWVGQLPRRRSVLYQKAIEVLLMTWNIEGHDPIDQEEAIPQLAYASYSMMVGGVTSATAKELAELFRKARIDLPDVLSYTTLSVHNFMRRVEERSSLLTLSGTTLTDGALVDVYEFKHLTFQEYLAAVAITNGYVSTDASNNSAVDLVAERFDDPSWIEVVTLTVALAGRHASQIIRLLLARVQQALAEGQPINSEASHPAYNSLLGCLEDEIAIGPELAQECIDACIRYESRSSLPDLVASALSGGRYADDLHQVALAGIQAYDEDLDGFIGSIGEHLFLTRKDWITFITKVAYRSGLAWDQEELARLIRQDVAAKRLAADGFASTLLSGLRDPGQRALAEISKYRSP